MVASVLPTGSTVTQRAHPAPRAQGARSAAYLEGTQATSNAAIGDAGAFERHRNYGRELLVERECDPDRRALAGRAEHAQRSAQCLHPVGEPDQPRAPCGIGAADAVVLDRDLQEATGGLDANVRHRGPGVLGG